MKKITLLCCLFLAACAYTGSQDADQASPAPSGEIVSVKPPQNEIEKSVYCFLTSMDNDIYSLCSAKNIPWDYVAPDVMKCTEEMNNRISSYTDRGLDYITPEGEIFMMGGLGHNKCGIHFNWHGRGVNDISTLRLSILEQNDLSAVVEADWYSSIESMHADNERIYPEDWARFFLRNEKGRWVIWGVVSKGYVESRNGSIPSQHPRG